MKYGENFQARSVPQWAPYNVDYDALKHLIKANTTRDAGQAVAIPGQVDTALQRFENQFFNELANQHDRVDLFVKCKADEINRRLDSSEQAVRKLLDRCAKSNGKPTSHKRREKFARYDDRITRCGEDIRLLQRFVREQRVAFYKILKKYKKWTGSRSVEDQFNSEVLSNPKSFTKTDFDPLLSRYVDLLSMIRSNTPDNSEPTTPSTVSRRPSNQIPVQPPPQQYWNEYDDGSEAENEPYMISIDHNADSSFPGSKALEFVVSRALIPVDKMRQWFHPTRLPGERRPLIANGQYFGDNHSIMDTDVDADDEAYASSSDLPEGYVTHYATFPSVSDQKLSRLHENILFRSCLGCFGAALILLLIACLLIATGRRKLRVEVDAGVITGVVASLFFAIMGFGSVCILDGMLLVLLAENSGI
ncbi:hypothetical protein G7Y89_g15186 [Cudoniella acicularis]|uniref:SPX domain-containing protein n=1 Tax=Cudoniella acicularis TaxID=354080 RepID=A0A8H4QS13_9HELO|nr:hypothetical protein G7Y89_g15186 [Cudoniella acicularis]